MLRSFPYCYVCLSSVYAVYQLPVPCLPLVLNLSIPYTIMPASFLVVHRHNARLFFGVRPFVRLFYCSSVLASCPAAILLCKQLLSVLVLSLLLIKTSESLIPILPLFAALHCVAFYLWSALTSCQKSCYLFILALAIIFVLPAYSLPGIYFYCPSFSILTYYYCPVHTLVSYYKLSYILLFFLLSYCYSYLLLAEFSVRPVNYEPSFFPLIYANRAGHKSMQKKTRIRNLQYGPKKRR